MRKSGMIPLTRPAPLSATYVAPPPEPEPEPDDPVFADSWVSLTSMSGELTELNNSAVYLPASNKIVVLGGLLYTSTATTGIRVYDVSGNSWSTLDATIPASSRYTKAILNNGKVLLMRNNSAWRNYTNLDDFSTYDSVTGSAQDSLAETAPVYHEGEAAVFLSNSLGFSPYNHAFMKFVIPTNTISTIHEDSTNGSRDNMGGGMLGDVYYVLGGDTRSSGISYAIFGYDVVLGEPVAVVETLPASWDGFVPRSSASDSSGIYIAGGSDGSVATDLAFVFDGETITPLPSLPSPSVDGALVATPGGLYYIGGAAGPTAFDAQRANVWFLARS